VNHHRWLRAVLAILFDERGQVKAHNVGKYATLCGKTLCATPREPGCGGSY
jgi:hypothetical protein